MSFLIPDSSLHFYQSDLTGTFFNSLDQIQELAKQIEATKDHPKQQSGLIEMLLLALGNTKNKGYGLRANNYKFVVGDKVYFLKDNRLKKGYIQQIVVTHLHEERFYVQYWVDCVNKEGNLYNEEDIFKTKEDLFEHLKKMAI